MTNARDPIIIISEGARPNGFPTHTFTGISEKEVIVMKKLSALILSIVILCSFTITAFADGMAWDVDPANYTVYVSAKGVGVNFRAGPGTEYEKLTAQPIPDSTALLLYATYNGWGLTSYNNMRGWVNLSYTTTEYQQKTTQAPTSAATTERTTTTQQTTVQTTTDTPKTSEQTAASESSETMSSESLPTTVPSLTQMQKNGSSDKVAIAIVLFVAIAILVVASAVLIIFISKKRKS